MSRVDPALQLAINRLEPDCAAADVKVGYAKGTNRLLSDPNELKDLLSKKAAS
jgi:hypothetical protein